MTTTAERINSFNLQTEGMYIVCPDGWIQNCDSFADMATAYYYQQSDRALAEWSDERVNYQLFYTHDEERRNFPALDQDHAKYILLCEDIAPPRSTRYARYLVSCPGLIRLCATNPQASRNPECSTDEIEV